MTLNETEKSITEDALNHFWHYTMTKIEKGGLGDIELQNALLDKKRLEELLERFRYPCT